LLGGWIEGDLAEHEHARVDAHVASCARCQGLTRDIADITHAAAALPDLSPARDLWKGIEARIQPGVVSIAPHRRSMWVQRSWMAVAAAALIVVSSSVTYRVGRDTGERNSAEQKASPSRNAGTREQDRKPESSKPEPAGTSAVPSPSGNVAAEPEAPVTQAPGSVRPAPRAPVARVLSASRATGSQPVDGALGSEIATLQALLNERRGELDASTVKTVEDNLAIIDAAVAQARAALARDPASGFLTQRLESTLYKKVELLRTVALMRSST
jgi:hypothetical protein